MERATVKTYIDQCNALDLSGAADCIEYLAAEIERLRRQIAIYQRTAKENGGAAVDAMVAQDQIAELRVEIERLKREAAASQAREQQLREALHYSLGAWYYDGVSNEHGSIYREANDRCDQPTDTSALEALIAKAGEVMRERCAKHVEAQYDFSKPMAAAIRALTGVKLEDLQK